MNRVKKPSVQISDEKLKTENGLLRKKLSSEFGMNDIHSMPDCKIENDSLNYIYEWEKQFAKKKRIKVYDRIGKPDFIKLEKLTPDKVAEELERLLVIMAENAIVLNCICDYDDSIIYKFVTEELFHEEIDDIRIKGMNTNFIYEEFYPNHEYDIRELTKYFFKSFLDVDWNKKHSDFQLADTIVFKQKQYKKDEFVKILLSFREDVKPVMLELIEIENVSFDIEKHDGTVNGEITFSVQEDAGYPAHVSGLFKLNVKFNDYYWEISELNLPGLE